MVFIIKPINAQLTKDKDLFGKMDPYCVCTIGHEKQRTKTHQGGGKKPQWYDTLQFQSNDTIMKVELYDDDIGKDDFIGEGSVNLNQLLSNPMRTENEYVDLVCHGKSSGRVLISMEYQGQPGSNQGGWGNNNSNWNNGQNQGGWGNGPNNGWGNNPNNSNWGNNPNNGWGNNNPNNGGWGNNPNNGWGQNPNNQNWGQGPNNNNWGQNQGNNGWGQNPNNGWGNNPNNNGWSNNPNNNGWGQGPSNNGWGNGPNNGW